MPRAIWSGSLGFGLVNVPVKLFSAVEEKGIHFHQFQEGTSQRIRNKRVNEDTGKEVEYDEIVKGYETSSGTYVMLTPEELESVEPGRTRSIDIEDFVDLDDVDPIYFDRTYYLAPDGDAAKRSYALLLDAMATTGKVAIARFVMRTKQYLAALRPKDGKLLISTMVYADEVVPAKEVGEFDGLDDIAVSDKELAMAKQLIESLSADFDPAEFRDEYRDKVLDLIERKAGGEEIVVEVPAPADEGRVVDLMAALEASVKEARAARSRHPAAPDAGADGDGDVEAEPEAAPEKPAKRTKKSA
jgi:DNA end-binding protein Ku